MEKIGKTAVEAFAALIGAVAGLYGGWTLGSRVLVVLMITDYLLGCACALSGHSKKTDSGHFLSKVAFMGLLRKGVIMAVILVAAMLDKAMVGAGGEHAALFRTASEFFYIASEALSIVENAGLMGVPVPKGLRRALEALREKNDGNNQE